MNRTSNVLLESLKLMEHWKYNAAVLVKDDNPIINGNIEMFLTSESLDTRLVDINPKVYNYFQTPVIKTVDAVLHQDVNGLIIHGLAPTELYITKEDLMPIQDEVDSIVIMLAVLEKAIDKKKAFELLSRKGFYIIGVIPNIPAKGAKYEFETMKRGDYDSVKLFLTKDHAQQYNHNSCPINKYELWGMAHFFQNWYGIIIEPHEDYWVEFNPQELDDMFK